MLYVKPTNTFINMLIELILISCIWCKTDSLEYIAYFNLEPIEITAQGTLKCSSLKVLLYRNWILTKISSAGA